MKNIINKNKKNFKKIIYLDKNKSIYDKRVATERGKYGQLLRKIYYLDDNLTIVGAIFEYEPKTTRLIKIITY